MSDTQSSKNEPGETGTETPVNAPFCAVDEIEDGQARSFPVSGLKGVYTIILARQGAEIFGYSNSCPHLGTPLDWAPDQFMDLSGQYLRCATHGAMFEIRSGNCISGPCEGDALRPLAVEIKDGKICLAEPGE
jgi:nitrite reductase/ring-hydroxylating ferredoxin subunit